uniref:Uncharacterized protein n=1 Tax=Panagrellus redivivus TaxID=6233 RepID=A0A7E4V316_PANRE
MRSMVVVGGPRRRELVVRRGQTTEAGWVDGLMYAEAAWLLGRGSTWTGLGDCMILDPSKYRKSMSSGY